MSDIDPELPDYLVDAILSEGPPLEAIDLVKNAFTWRTIDAELMELSYDSVLDDAGVRDASARRTMEFTLGELSIVIEVDGLSIRGNLQPPERGVLSATQQDRTATAVIDDQGRFSIEMASSGPLMLVLALSGGSFALPALALG